MTSPQLNAYLCSEYLYHYSCHSCGHIMHSRPGCAPDDCPACGGCCWKTRQTAPGGGPWYVQLLDPGCPTCRKTQSALTRINAQMELFGTEARP